jgi:transcription initiation factor IIE alpha subunit
MHEMVDAIERMLRNALNPLIEEIRSVRSAVNTGGNHHLCPFCKSDKTRFVFERAHQQGFVLCDGCGARGPSGDDTHEAVEQWSKATVGR